MVYTTLMTVKRKIQRLVTQAGIYHNPSLWLISLSSDWENRITIADKNLWATEYVDWISMTDSEYYNKFTPSMRWTIYQDRSSVNLPEWYDFLNSDVLYNLYNTNPFWFDNWTIYNWLWYYLKFTTWSMFASWTYDSVVVTDYWMDFWWWWTYARPFKNEPVIPTSERTILYQPN